MKVLYTFNQGNIKEFLKINYNKKYIQGCKKFKHKNALRKTQEKDIGVKHKNSYIQNNIENYKTEIEEYN